MSPSSAGSGSACRTTRSETARVRTTYRRFSPRGSSATMRAGSRATTVSNSSPFTSEAGTRVSRSTVRSSGAPHASPARGQRLSRGVQERVGRDDADRALPRERGTALRDGGRDGVGDATHPQRAVVAERRRDGDVEVERGDEPVRVVHQDGRDAEPGGQGNHRRVGPAQVRRRLAPAAGGPRRRALREVAQHRQRSVRAAPRERTALHRRQVLRLVHDDVGCSGAAGRGGPPPRRAGTRPRRSSERPGASAPAEAGAAGPAPRRSGSRRPTRRAAHGRTGAGGRAASGVTAGQTASRNRVTGRLRLVARNHDSLGASA